MSFYRYPFRTEIDAGKGAFEVTYRDANDIGRRKRFNTEEQAQKYADVTGGKVAPVVKGRFKLAPITGQ